MAGGRLAHTPQCDQQGEKKKNMKCECNSEDLKPLREQSRNFGRRNSSLMWWRRNVIHLQTGEHELPLFCQHKVAEIREMIMEEGEGGNLMGGNYLDVTVILMSSCQIPFAWHRWRERFIASLFSTQWLVLLLAHYFLLLHLRYRIKQETHKNSVVWEINLLSDISMGI